jgi:pimeloyl-ACP methyl ester carboxylesterase
LSAYIAPQGSMNIVVGESSTEKLQTLARVIEARRTRVTLQPPAGPSVDVEVWGDETGRLLRVNIPTQAVDAVREDIGAVSTRRVTVSREGDEQVKVPANGFALAGTLSRPSNTPAGSRLPAVVLVGGSGPTDREETVAGIAIFGELANGFADAGFLVLRYDKRGVGQSGARPESATMADFADDLRAAVRTVSDRRDVDRKRVAVVGYAEGGAVGLIAATREDRITAIALVAASGVTGAEFNMAQVTSALDRAKRPEAERESTIALQKKIQTAVLTGQGWDEIPPGLRKQADIPWFQSFLAYDPAQTMKDVKQPLLVVHGLLDTEVDPSNADKLDAMARARRRNVPVQVVKVPGVNHLLAAAKTGAVDEYGTLEEKRVSPLVVTAITDWLNATFAAVR